MNNDILFTATIHDYLSLDRTGTRLNTLADNFFHASRDLLQQIAEAMDDNNHTLWRSHLHTLKGIAGVAGARNLHDLCDRLRIKNNKNFIDTPEDVMTELHDAIDKYQDAIHQTLESTPGDNMRLC